MMEIRDDVSILSDDTDYLVSMKCRFEHVIDDDQVEDVAEGRSYMLTKSYVDSFDDRDLSFDIHGENDQQPTLSFEKVSVNSSGFKSSSISPKMSNIVELTTQSMNSRHELSIKQFCNAQNCVTKTAVNESSESGDNIFNFHALDEKVEEGQNIISRLLAEMNTNGYNMPKSQKSFETSLVSRSPMKNSSFISSPVHTNHYINNAVHDVMKNRNSNEDGNQETCKEDCESVSEHSSDDNDDQDCNDTETLLNDVVMIKDQLVSMEVQKNKEITSLKERSQAKIASLEQSLDTLQKQKENLLDHVTQLKESLGKKNTKCIQLQDLLHEKSQHISQLITKDDQERVNLQNEVGNLQKKKMILDKQVSELEKALNKQLLQIKELGECFQVERQRNAEQSQAKNEEITSLYEFIKEQNEASQALKSTTESKRQKELNIKETTEDNLRHLLTQEQQRTERLQDQFKKDVEGLLDKLNAVKATNRKLKQENRQMKTENIELTDKINKTNTQSCMEKDDIQKLKTKLTEYERFEKSLILELSEESTKFAVIMGIDTTTTPSKSTPSKRLDSPNRNNILAKSGLKELKEQFEKFRQFTLSLVQGKENASLNKSMDSLSSLSPMSTSAKLVKHLQNRVQQLRKENTALRDTSHMKTQSMLSINNDHYEDIANVQKLLKQATKENLLLEKTHAQLQQTFNHAHSNRVITRKFQEDTKKLTTVLSCTHTKALGPSYIGTSIQKYPVNQSFVPWCVKFPDYYPVEYTSPVVLKEPVWADPDISSSSPAILFNTLDGNIDRRSHMGHYTVHNGRPMNPIGRTGMTGRGLLGKWGPNHAADPVVTCWRRDVHGKTVTKDGKAVLQFIAILRKDTKEWAIPGGMVDAGEKVSAALMREFGEEALDSLQNSHKDERHKNIQTLFKDGVEVFKGYVDDPRNTDNAWMETTVVNFHDNSGDGLSRLRLSAGDDASSVQWKAIDGYCELFASHMEFIRKICRLHAAYCP